MADGAKRLDLSIGDGIQAGDRCYDVVSDKADGIALEPAVSKTIDDLRVEHGGRALTPEEFEQHFG